MFVTKSRHRKTLIERNEASAFALLWRTKYNELLDEWNALVDKVNAGHYTRTIVTKGGQFSDEEIQTLINLCHPDKHNGSARATAMTQRLLALRKKK